jgi:hypothetical protein
MNQLHECAPGMTEAEYFATGPAHERPVFEAVMAHVETLGPVHVEFVSVGIFLKRAQTFAELRPLERWVAVWFLLPRPVSHRLIVRKVLPYHGRYVHVANLRRPEDLDDDLRSSLTEAYLDSPA